MCEHKNVKNIDSWQMGENNVSITQECLDCKSIRIIGKNIKYGSINNSRWINAKS